MRLSQLLTVTAVALAAGALGATGTELLRPSADDPVLAGCVIRFDERSADGLTVPRVHVNEGHACVGVDAVRVDAANGDLLIDNVVPSPIVSVLVSPDETLVGRGIDCGGSGGGGLTRIACHDDGGRVRLDSADVYGPASNLWVFWMALER